jgi:hypothetical protein
MQATVTASVSAQTDRKIVDSVCAQPAAGNETPQSGASMRVYGRCIRGFMAGLCMEGLLALSLYGIYHLGQILH